jgi:hypothetical protein
MEKAPTIRVQHNGQRDPAGSGIKLEINRDGDGAHWVKGVVDEPVAQRLVRKGHLRAFSVGVAAPVIERDLTGKARGGIITGGRIVEVSLVDSPANRSCFLEVAKAAADGSPEFTGRLSAPDDVLAKFAEPEQDKGVTVTLPKNMSLSVKPSDLAKLATFKQRLTAGSITPPAITKTPAPDAAKAVTDADNPELTAVKTAEAAVYKRDVDTATRRRLAGEGKALPNLSYPIENTEDLQNAATLARSGHGDVSAARRLISRRARDLKVPNPLKGKKGNATKAAEPQVTKCGACNDSGMADGKPCTECKKGKKAGRRAEKTAAKAALTLAAAPDAEKKSKVMCGGCGARQNSKHAMCSECGRPMTGAMGVEKNHDYTCLGCGKALDKGEKHCPGCGRENPGYNPMADHKIPANADKAAGSGADKGRVTKRKKSQVKGGKKRDKKEDSSDGAFGGKKSPPFGAKDEPDENGKKPPKAEKRRKGKGKGRSPAEGVTSQHTEGLPPHREPDGAPVEEFEKDTRLEDGDEHQEMAAAMRHKALVAKGLSREDALLHDLTCPAFSSAALAKAFPYESLATVNTDAWQVKALDAAATAELSQAGKAMQLWQHACTLKGTDTELAHDLREEAHQAFRKANKAFRDATPGPGSFPTPGHVTPQQFRRPYLSEGHAAPSPQHKGPHSFGVPEGQPSAEDYTRDLITAGHAADSPQNDTPRHEPQPAPSTPGRPDRVYYRGTMRDNARQAMTAMHDHIARVFPDVCPMSPELGGTQKPAPPVPEGVGGPAPRRSAKTQKAGTRKKAKTVTRKRRTPERKTPGGKPAAVAKAASVPAPPAALSPDVIKAMVTEANAPLLERIAAQDKTLRRQRKALDAIASQPDTSQAPLRGVALTKASAAPAAPQSVAKSAEQAQAAQLQMLHHEWRNSPDPVQREAAYRALTTQLGISPVPSQT